jgi:hypothetical protein
VCYLINFAGGGLPSYPVPLAATRADENNFVMAIFPSERDVKTAFIPALVAGVKFPVDLFFDHFFHGYKPPEFSMKRLMVTGVLIYRDWISSIT